MAERLTTRFHGILVKEADVSKIQVITKLGQLEDIMEKYGIEDLEQYLLKMRKIDKELRDTIQKLHTIIDSIGYDRNNWQKACELACNKLVDYEWENKESTHSSQYWLDYFYQQAKKEE